MKLIAKINLNSLQRLMMIQTRISVDSLKTLKKSTLELKGLRIGFHRQMGHTEVLRTFHYLTDRQGNDFLTGDNKDPLFSLSFNHFASLSKLKVNMMNKP